MGYVSVSYRKSRCEVYVVAHCICDQSHELLLWKSIFAKQLYRTTVSSYFLCGLHIWEGLGASKVMLRHCSWQDEAADIANCFLLSRCLRNRPKCYIYFSVLSSSPVLFPFQTFCLALNFFLLHRWFPTTMVILMKKQVHRQYPKCVLKQKSKTCLWNFHKSEIGSLDRKAQIFKKVKLQWLMGMLADRYEPASSDWLRDRRW